MPLCCTLPGAEFGVANTPRVYSARSAARQARDHGVAPGHLACEVEPAEKLGRRVRTTPSLREDDTRDLL